MALELTVDNLENVQENLRNLYVEKDGKYQLDVSGIEDTGGLKSALDKEREAHKRLEKATKSWEKLGKTPEEIAEILQAHEDAEKAKAEKAGDWEKLKAQMNDSHAKEIAAKDNELASMRKALDEYLIDAQATSAIAAAKGVPELLLPHVKQHVKVMEENGKYNVTVVDAKGDPRINGKGEPLTIADLVVEMKQSEIYGRAFEGTGQTGSGKLPTNAGGGTTLKRSQMTPKQRTEYMSEHGQAAYLTLPK